MSAWLSVHDRLVELLPTLPGWSSVYVFDGPPITGDAPTDYTTVGYAFEEDAAGTFETEAAANDFSITEVGGVRCELVSLSGDADAPAVRARALGLLASLEAAIRADSLLGVLPPGSTSRLLVDVIPLQTTAGAVQRLPFTVAYTARTY